jgi:hypothetical protein
MGEVRNPALQEAGWDASAKIISPAAGLYEIGSSVHVAERTIRSLQRSVARRRMRPLAFTFPKAADGLSFPQLCQGAFLARDRFT